MLNRDGAAALADIYDAAINPGRWRRALDGVAAAVGGKAIALLIRSDDPDATDRQMLSTTYLNLMRSPWGIYYVLRLSKLQNPDWNFLSRQPVHVPTPDTQIGIGADALDRRADYTFLRKRLGVGRRLGVRLNADKVWFDAMSVAFETDRPVVPQIAFDTLMPLLPHVTKAVEMGRTFAQLKARYSAALTALDHVKVGLAIALPSGEVIIHNEEAARILSMRDGIARQPDGRFRCSDADQNAMFQAALGQAARTAQGTEQISEVLLALRRPSGAAPILVDVAPLKDSKTELDSTLEGALITIIDPDRVPYLRMDRFIALYHLTPAEAEVCALIIQGRAIDEIAEERSTSPLTVKNQIAAVLEKTGVNRRAELIRLVIRVLPPID